jgi:hypothetical protein
MGARYYDPTIARWTQMDTILGRLVDPQSLNRYLFASNDPVNVEDPSGHWCWWDFVVGVAILVFVAVLIWIATDSVFLWYS